MNQKDSPSSLKKELSRIFEYSRDRTVPSAERYVHCHAELDRLEAVFTEPDQLAEIYRKRSYIFKCQKNILKAREEIERIMDCLEGQVRIGDYYKLAHLHLKSGHFRQALNEINQGILLSHEQGDDYFMSELLFMKAFCFIKLNCPAEFDEMVDLLEPGEVWLDRPAQPYAREELIEMRNRLDSKR